MSVKSIVAKQYRTKVNQVVRQLGGAIEQPKEGWIRTTRIALGMPGTQLAKNLGVTKARVSKAELDEPIGSVTLKTMHDMAHAMECKFVYAIVPKQEVEEVIKQRAKEKARKMVKRASTQMALEAQALSKEQLEQEIERIAHKIMEKMPSDFWGNE